MLIYLVICLLLLKIENKNIFGNCIIIIIIIIIIIMD